MNLIEQLIKVRLATSKFSGFEADWSVGFCQGDFVNIFGSLSNDGLEEALGKIANPVIGQAARRMLTEVEPLNLEVTKEHCSGCQTRMDFPVQDVESYYLDMQDQRETIESSALGDSIFDRVIAEWCQEQAIAFKEEVKDFCQETLSLCHDLLLRCASDCDPEVVIEKSIGHTSITASYVGEDHWHELEGEDQEVLDTLTKEDIRFGAFKVEIAFHGFEKTYYLGNVTETNETLKSNLVEFVSECISEFRADVASLSGLKEAA